MSERLARQFRVQGDACARLGSPLYAALMHAAADDLLAGGPAADVLHGRPDAPLGHLVPLRLFGAVHRLVLERRAPALALHYPSVGGTPGTTAQVLAAFLDVLREHADEVRAGLGQAPQTNEVGRAGALLGGLHALVAERDLPVRLVEIGASAGLNLRVDRMRFVGSDIVSYGPSHSPLVLADAWPVGPAWARVGRPPLVLERTGTDPAPVDPTTTDGRLLLTSYVWPDMTTRLERLRAAFVVAAATPVDLRAGTALDAVRTLHPTSGAWTVLWHSVMWQYVPPEEAAAALALLDGLGAAATPDAPLARVAFEPSDDQGGPGDPFEVRLTTWPGGQTRLLGTAPPHGLPVSWVPAAS